jgi:hypothetical protein
MFWTRPDVAELRRQNDALRKDLEDMWEVNANTSQQLGSARIEADRMKLAYTEEGLDEIALVTARRIEDLFVGCPGGRDNRLNIVKGILREVMRANLTGSTNWKGPGEPTYRRLSGEKR